MAALSHAGGPKTPSGPVQNERQAAELIQHSLPLETAKQMDEQNFPPNLRDQTEGFAIRSVVGESLMDAESVRRVDGVAHSAGQFVLPRNDDVLIAAKMVVGTRSGPALAVLGQKSLVSVQQPGIVFLVHHLVVEHIEYGLTKGVTSRFVIPGDHIAARAKRHPQWRLLPFCETSLRIDRSLLVKLVDQLQVDQDAGDGAVADMCAWIAVPDRDLAVAAIDSDDEGRCLGRRNRGLASASGCFGQRSGQRPLPASTTAERRRPRRGDESTCTRRYSPSYGIRINPLDRLHIHGFLGRSGGCRVGAGRRRPMANRST